MYQKSRARLVVWTTLLAAALATADSARGGTLIEPEVVNLAGLAVAVWQPTGSPGPYSLVLFSHGAGGCKTQSTYLINALAQDGMLVAAPDHSDKSGNCPARLPKPDDLPSDLLDVRKWGPSFHVDRGDDLQRLRAALEADPAYSGLIDTRRVALVGHSLGGYTALALAGVWPSWKMDAITAVVALAPYSQPFVRGGMPSEIEVPVLFQVGSEDELTPEEVVRPIFAASGAPACISSYQGADHFSWTDLQRDFHDVTAAAVTAFLDEVFPGAPGRRLSWPRPEPRRSRSASETTTLISAEEPRSVCIWELASQAPVQVGQLERFQPSPWRRSPDGARLGSWSVPHPFAVRVKKATYYNVNSQL